MRTSCLVVVEYDVLVGCGIQEYAEKSCLALLGPLLMPSEVLLGLSREMGKSSLQVIFGPCIKAVLGVSQWYWCVFYGVLWCFMVFYGGLGPKTGVKAVLRYFFEADT